MHTRPPDAVRPTTSPQRQLWFLDQLRLNPALYNLCVAFAFSGDLDTGALERSLVRLVERHEVLRSVLRADGGEPVQVVRHHVDVPLRRVDLAGLSGDAARREYARVEAELANEPFDLAAGPLVRFLLVRMPGDAPGHVLLVGVHHAVFDGWSQAPLADDLRRFYLAESGAGSEPPPPLALQFGDYAERQRQEDPARASTHADFWRTALRGCPPVLALPTDKPRPPVASHRGGLVGVPLPAPLLHDLRTLGARRRATLFMTLLAGYTGLLHRLSGQDDLAIGLPLAMRSHAQLEPMIGFFVSVLPLRSQVDWRTTFEDLVDQTKARVRDVMHHSEFGLERVVDDLNPERDLSSNPLFQVSFDMWVREPPQAWRDGLVVEVTPVMARVSRFDLHLTVDLLPDGSGRASLEHSLDLFRTSGARTLLRRYVALLRAAAANPSARVEELDLLSRAERGRAVTGWNQTATTWPAERSFLGMFDRRVREAPDAPAVAAVDRTLTYRELDERSAALAARLRRHGVGPERVVAISTRRTSRLVVAVLAVLRAGGAYVSIEPGNPAERRRAMVSDSRAVLLLVDAEMRDACEPGQAEVLVLDDDLEAGGLGAGGGGRPPEVQPENVAYVIYTSGSTGRPKGVQVSHGALGNMLLTARERPGLAQGDVLVAVCSLSFDVSVFELLVPLAAGARIELATEVECRDGDALARRLRRAGATAMFATPATWRLLLESGWSGDPAFVAMVGGEVLTPELAAALNAACGAVWNVYGPAEGAVFITTELVGPAVDAVPVGVPIANGQAYVLDRVQQPVPPGVLGEVWISGAGLARGYLDRPAETADRFRPHPFPPAPGARAYRTGDLARRLPDGRVVVAGRLDHQVKVRGHRVELGEVEKALERHPRVRQAVVEAAVDRSGTTVLVAYARPEEPRPDHRELRDFLSRSLPDYMLPLAIVVLDELPLSPNGKVDRRLLPDWRLAGTGGEHVPQARDDVELALVGLWREVLQVPDVQVDDDFFRRGGHSFLAVRLVGEINRRFGLDVPVATLFRNPTVEQLADAVRAERRASAPEPQAATAASPAIPRRAGTVRLPVTLVQENHLRREQWRDARGLPDRALNVDVAYRLRGGRLDEPALLAALNAVVRRHDALRVRFEAVDDTFAQVIQASATVELETLVPEPAADPLSAVRGLLQRRSREHSNRWSPGPRLRAGLVRLGPDDQVLSLSIDHLLCDGWSLGVLLHEVSRLYTGDGDLPEPGLRYGDWVSWACERLDSADGERDRAYWLEQLADISPRPPVEFPFRPRGRRLPGLTGVMTTAAMPAGLARPAAYGSGLTPFVLFCSAVQLLLHATTGEPAVGVVSPVANRGRPETRDLVGWLSNTVLLRLDVHDGDRVGETAARTRVALEGAIEHGEHTIHDVIRRLSPGVFGRIRDTASAYVSTHLDPPAPFALGDLDTQPLPFDDPFSLHGIQFGLRPAGDGLEVAILCESGWLTGADLDGLGADLRLVAEAVVERPELPVADLRRSLALAHPRFRT